MAVYRGQTALKLKFFIKDRSGSSVDISNANCILKYKNKTSIGSFALENGVASNELFWIPQSENDINIIGKWVLWAKITFDDGKTIASEPVTIQVKEEGT